MMDKPSLAVRVSILIATLSIPVIVAMFLVYPTYGVRAAVLTGFALGIPAVLFATRMILNHDWLE